MDHHFSGGWINIIVGYRQAEVGVVLGSQVLGCTHWNLDILQCISVKKIVQEEVKGSSLFLRLYKYNSEIYTEGGESGSGRPRSWMHSLKI